jgi:hypothetical protein
LGIILPFFQKNLRSSEKTFLVAQDVFPPKLGMGGDRGGGDCLVLAKRFSTQTLVFLVE